MAGTGVDTREVITDKTALFQSFCPIRKKKAEFQVITTQGNTRFWEQGVCEKGTPEQDLVVSKQCHNKLSRRSKMR